MGADWVCSSGPVGKDADGRLLAGIGDAAFSSSETGDARVVIGFLRRGGGDAPFAEGLRPLDVSGSCMVASFVFALRLRLTSIDTVDFKGRLRPNMRMMKIGLREDDDAAVGDSDI